MSPSEHRAPQRETSPARRARAWVMGIVLGIASPALAQLPTVAAFIDEPLHPVRGRLLGAMAADPDPHLGAELTMPSSVAAGGFDAPRDHFERHPVMLPTLRVTWAYGRSLDDELHHADRNEYTPMPTEARGEGWVSLIERSGTLPDVQVVTRIASPAGELHCIGSGGSEVTEAGADRVRDWLLARCRSVRIVALP